MSKQRIPVFLDMENEDALKELKTYLPVDQDIKDSPIIRYALLELLNRVRKEINFEKSIRFFVFIRDYDQCKIGARSYQNTRPFFF
ncbi:hypothetical protein GCM10025854_06820 [Tetragenococcus muriaticus]|nr:hypothetical protein GCM10025854_06820 [Tetragenococcus muriaticus]